MSLILGVQTGLVYIILCNVVHYRRLTDEDGIPSTASVPECQEICKQTEQGCGGSRDQHPIASLRQGLVAPEWAEMGLQINRNGKVYDNIWHMEWQKYKASTTTLLPLKGVLVWNNSYSSFSCLRVFSMSQGV